MCPFYPVGKTVKYKKFVIIKKQYVAQVVSLTGPVTKQMLYFW